MMIGRSGVMPKVGFPQSLHLSPVLVSSILGLPADWLAQTLYPEAILPVRFCISHQRSAVVGSVCRDE